MISVLIPVYNRDVNELVNALSLQVTSLNRQIEITVMDDGSDAGYKKLNGNLNAIPFVRYIDAGSNHGRIRIRQMLANEALYEWLLFLDCDSKIISAQFLEAYYQQVSDAVPVIVGGRRYTSHKPGRPFMLHWLYGSVREVSRLDNHPGHTNRFMTNNLFIKKSIFQQFTFTDEWGGYGYEDTWMGIQLEVKRVPVLFINNQVLHDGLENSEMFLLKSRQALKNLKRLSRIMPEEVLATHVKLYHYYCKLKSRRLLWLIRMGHFVFQNLLEKNLCSCKPSLVLFDVYRLGWFVRNAKKAGS